MLHQIVVEGLNAVEHMPLSQRQRDRIAERKLRSVLLDLKESNAALHTFHEKVNGKPLAYWLLSNDLLHCASTFMEFATRHGCIFLLSEPLNHQVFYPLIESRDYHIILNIFKHIWEEGVDIIKPCLLQDNFKISKLLSKQFSSHLIFNPQYLELLSIILLETPFKYFPLSQYFAIHHAFSVEEKKFQAHYLSAQKENAKKSVQARQGTDSHLTDLFQRNVSALLVIKNQLEKAKPIEWEKLTEKDQTRRSLIQICHHSIQSSFGENCCDLEKKYEKAAWTMRKMR